MARNKVIRINANDESLPKALAFVEEAFRRRRVSAKIASEMKLLFEAVCREIVAQLADETAELEICSVSKIGCADIEITFPGSRFSLPSENAASSPGASIIEEHLDKISCSFHHGDNVVQIAVSQSIWSFILPNLVAVIAAVIVATVLEFTIDDAGRQLLATDWVAPLKKLFTNAMLMIGAPMTLFSLLKNVTDAFIVAGRHSSSRTLFMTAMSSSVVAVVLAAVMGFVFAQWILSTAGVTESFDIGFANWSLASAVDQIIPSSIVEPFETISPIPMIVVALLVAGSLSSIGQSFSLVKRAVDACYDLFSGILGILMIAFPVACFLLFLEVLLATDGVVQFLDILGIVAIVFVCTVPLLAFYALVLKVHGIPVMKFARTLWPLLKENFSIGSVIDAVPFNTRYCERHFGVPRKRLGKELPMLAQVCLDGNCFILMLLAAIYIFVANCEVSWINIVVIGLIVMFLSFGAPNQPGSILIGMLVILTYLNSDTAVSLALCFELFCGPLQNILNVISSVVTVVVRQQGSRNEPSQPGAL